MAPWGFHINAKGFVKSLVRDELREKVVEIVNDLGPAKIAWLIQNNRPLGSLLPPAREAELRGKARAPGYRRAADMITDQDFYDMLPEWVWPIIETTGEQGQGWLQQQIAWMRGFFGGEHGRRGESDIPVGTHQGFRITRVRGEGAPAEEPGPRPPAQDQGIIGLQGQAPGGAEENE